MKILHINCNYLGSTLHQLMVEKLELKGIKNTVFVPTYNATNSIITPNSYVDVCECFNKTDRFIFDYKQRKILKIIEEKYDVSSFDLIHAYTLYTDGNIASILSQKYNIPFVVAVRNTDVNAFLKYRFYLRNRGVNILKSSSSVFFLSNSYLKKVINRYVPAKDRELIIEKSRVIPNGINDFWLKNVNVAKNYNDVVTRINNKEVGLIYAGGLDRNKNITRTCYAIDKLKKEGWNIKFTVVGKIVDQLVFDEIKEKVDYLGVLTKEELIQSFRASDIFVMPSKYETFGLVYAEAMTQGLPVVYSKGQGFDEQFEEGYVGVHVNSKSTSDVVEAIKFISNNYVEMSKHAIENSNIFAWDRIVNEYLELYSQFAKDGLIYE